MLVAKTGTPQAVVTRLQTALRKVVTSEAMLAGLRASGSEPGKTPPGQLTRFLQQQVDFWEKQLRRANVQPS
jgi:tripartite-type tricarboxylate transporter receptor subunit TctC